MAEIVHGIRLSKDSSAGTILIQIGGEQKELTLGEWSKLISAPDSYNRSTAFDSDCA